jgi:hypothetical protein
MVRLERIARNIIQTHLRMERVDANLGNIYLAHGYNAANNLAGVWGYMDVARDLEFNEGTSLDEVRQALLNDAAGTIEMMAERGLLDGPGKGHAKDS